MPDSRFAIVVGAIVVATACGSDRQQEVASRGAEVMPFDLDATTHRFEATGYGGIQTVTADDPADAEQIRLVRRHLEAEAVAFRAGDFSDPTKVHGEDMPGVSVLSSSAGQIDLTLETVVDGARIIYRTDDAELVAALHEWFEAQTSDHGEHAEPS